MRDLIRLVETVDPSPGAFYELVGEVAFRMLSEFQSGTPHQPWKLVPAQRLIAIWTRAAKEGFVQDEKGIDYIATVMIENTARLVINNEISGHSTTEPEAAIRNYGLNDELERDQYQAFIDWAVDLPTGGWRISDYGIDSLVKLACSLANEPTSEEKLVLIDRMLNVTHQRSDLASWFVDGAFGLF